MGTLLLNKQQWKTVAAKRKKTLQTYWWLLCHKAILGFENSTIHLGSCKTFKKLP
jgi:hypothetical protein